MKSTGLQVHVRRLSRLALASWAVLLCACSGPTAVERGPAPSAHRVEVAAPGPWAPDPAPRPDPALDPPTQRPAAAPGRPAFVVGDTPRTAQRPGPRQVMPGEAAITQRSQQPSDPGQARPLVAVDQSPRSEILPQPEDRPRPLHAAWLAGSAYNQLYRPEQLATFEAVVQAVETFVPADGAEPGLLLRVSAQGQERLIHVGPLRDLRDRGTRFNYQDSITVQASPTPFAGQTVYLARQITRGETRIEFRDDKTGRPVWDSEASP